MYNLKRSAPRRPLTTGLQLVACSSPLKARRSRLTAHGSQLTARSSRLTAKSLTLATACLTLLLACQQQDTKNISKDSTATAAISGAKVKQAPDTTVLDGPWFLQPVLPSDTATGKRANLRLDLKKGRFTGNTGCNNMSGKFWYSDTDSSLTFSDKLVTTKMACTGFNEKAFLKSLMLTTHYKLRNGVLTFLAEDNTELSRWERKPSAPANTGKA